MRCILFGVGLFALGTSFGVVIMAVMFMAKRDRPTEQDEFLGV